MKKLNNKGFLLVETIVVATFTLTVLIVLFLQFKNLLVSYKGSYNYNTVEGIYNLNTVKNYVMQYQNSENPLNKQLQDKNYLVLYNGSCNVELGTVELDYCNTLMEQGNFKSVIFSSSDPTQLKEYLKSHEDSNISEEMKNLIKRLEKVEHQNRLIAEYKDGTLATIVFGVDNDTKPAEPKPELFTGTIYRWSAEQIKTGDNIEGKDITTDPTTLNKNYYLKHDVVDNKITASYVCFITDQEYCIQGGNESYHDANKELLQSQQEWFTNNGGSCSNASSRYTCRGGTFDMIYASSSGYIYAEKDSINCYVKTDGNTACGE